MSFSEVLMYVIAAFMVLGAIDKITYGKLKLDLADSFDEGIETMGPLALSVIGILSLAPALEGIVIKLVGPLYSLIGADPAMFAGTVLSSDTGAFPLAAALTDDYQVVCFSGLVLGGVLGVVIGFTIPIALGIIDKKDRKYFAQGVLYGIITVPVGSLAGGIVAGFPLDMILINSIPTIIISVLLALGVKLFTNAMIKGFEIFGKFIVIIITIGLVAAILEALTGIVIIKGMAPIEEGFVLVGKLAIVLAGAFPMLHVITKALRRPLAAGGSKMGVNESSVAGLIACLANAIPMLSLMKNMDERGKVINSAFVVSGSFILGDHLAYTASVDSNMLLPVIVAKGVSGLLAAVLAIMLTRKSFQKNEPDGEMTI